MQNHTPQHINEGASVLQSWCFLETLDSTVDNYDLVVSIKLICVKLILQGLTLFFSFLSTSSSGKVVTHRSVTNIKSLVGQRVNSCCCARQKTLAAMVKTRVSSTNRVILILLAGSSTHHWVTRSHCQRDRGCRHVITLLRVRGHASPPLMYFFKPWPKMSVQAAVSSLCH